MSATAPTPGSWLLTWGGYSQIVTVYCSGASKTLRFRVASGYSHDVASVPGATWVPARHGLPLSGGVR